MDLQFWTHGSEDYWAEAARRFLAAHPDVNGAVDIPLATRDHGKSLVIARIAAGNPPDVIVVDDIDLLLMAPWSGLSSPAGMEQFNGRWCGPLLSRSCQPEERRGCAFGTGA